MAKIFVHERVQVKKAMGFRVLPLSAWKAAT